MKKPKCLGRYLAQLKDCSNKNTLSQFTVSVFQPVENGEQLLVVLFRANTEYKIRNKIRNWSGDMPHSVALVASKKQNDYVLFEASGARIRNTLSEWVHNCGTSIYSVYPTISDMDEKRLCKWTGAKSTTNHYIPELSARLNDMRAEKKEVQRAARGEIDDADYTLCPSELPDDFEYWLRSKVIRHDNILLYKKGGVRGRCYICGEKVRLPYGDKHFRQYEKHVCPNCCAEVWAILDGGQSWNADYVENVAALQMGKDGKTLFIREWHLCRDPEAKYTDINKWLDEFARYAIRGEKVARWLHESKEQWGLYKYYRTDRGAWERVAGTRIYDGGYKLFDGNIRDVTSGTKLQYADIIGYMNKPSKHYNNPIRFMLDFARYPVLEFLQKRGFDNLIKEWIKGVEKNYRAALNRQGKTLKQCFHFPLRWLDAIPADEWTWQNLAAANWLYKTTPNPDTLTLDDVADVICEKMVTDRLSEVIRFVGIRKLMKYLKSQPRTGLRLADIQYADYIGECVKLGLDTTKEEVLFPRDLEAAHMRTAVQCKAKDNERFIESFKAQTEKLEKYRWQKGTLMIVPARHPDELTAEGAALHHCVGGYVERVAKGETAIFFIRKTDAPDVPYYTVELKDKKVRQCFTSHDKTCEEVGEPFIRDFLDAWLKRVVEKGGVKKPRKKAKTA